MKIQQVRFKNLNSLTGEWLLDLTHPAYESDGIFAISGPTGAGKTTILDAVCLALYGRTPRLGKVTKGDNEIMSRQAGECFAEVTFETGQGSFRSHWSQHRARKKPGNELQPPKHEISDAVTGAMLESRIRDVAETIESVTGMDFDRFTRTMLLAQGSFAAFLLAPPDERAPILEEITGTEVYSRISIGVHERRAEERKKLETLQAELAAVRLLSEEEEGGLLSLLGEKQDHELTLARRAESLRKMLAWLDSIAFLERELALLDEKWRDFLQRQETFQPELIRLERARKALSLEAAHGRLASLRKQQAEENRERDELRKALPTLETALDQIVRQREIASGQMEKAREQRKLEGEVITRVRELDVKIREKEIGLKSLGEGIARINLEIIGTRNRIERDISRRDQSLADLESAEKYLAANIVDAGLVENLAAIRRIVGDLGAAERKIEASRAALAAAVKNMEETVNACRESEATKNASERALSEAKRNDARLAEELADLLLWRELSEWRRELDGLKERNRLLEQAGETLSRLSATNLALREQEKRRDALAVDQSRLGKDILVLTETKAEQEREVARLERETALVGRIRDLEEERARLADGKPCPLCGATEHPFARGNLPEMNETEEALACARVRHDEQGARLASLRIKEATLAQKMEQTLRDINDKKTTIDGEKKRSAALFAALGLTAAEEEIHPALAAEGHAARERIKACAETIDRAEAMEKEKKTMRRLLDKAGADFTESEKALQKASHAKKSAERDLERLRMEAEDLAIELSVRGREAIETTAAYGVEDLLAGSPAKALENLAGRRDRWLARRKSKEELEKHINAVKMDLEKQQTLLYGLERNVQARGEERDKLAADIDALKRNRQDLYGGKNPGAEEKRLAEAIAEAEKRLEQSRCGCAEQEKHIGGLKERIAFLDRATDARAEELNQAERELASRFLAAGFADEEDFRRAVMPEEKRSALEKQADALLLERTTMETRRKDRADQLATERGKELTDMTREPLEERLTAHEAELKEARQEIGAIRQRLAENDRSRQLQINRLGERDRQKKECARWDTLHELIGSADGKKYRNFAQGLTFEMVIAHANRQLRKMTDRYLLVRDAGQPLELNVIDNYQAGEIRSAKNLSGGESFIVSLSLALGLSSMAGRNVRVDSLFLDEGFGTLDEDALETALETLSELRRDGKLIGVISHVPALKERIGTHIEVIPRTGGRSILRGPGCRRLNAGNS